MLSLDRCRAILNEDRQEVRYSDEDIVAVRDFLYALARTLGARAPTAPPPPFPPRSRGS